MRTNDAQPCLRDHRFTRERSLVRNQPRPSTPPLWWLAEAGSAGWPRRWLLSPQQTAVPFVLIPQVWSAPALTVVKVPAGGVAWPKSLSPQQARVPSVLIPQVWQSRR